MTTNRDTLEMFAVDLTYETAMYTSDTFPTYREAVEYVDEVVQAWSEETGIAPDCGWASSDNMYCCKVGKRFASVVRAEG